jgi:hypothetical protein
MLQLLRQDRWRKTRGGHRESGRSLAPLAHIRKRIGANTAANVNR